MLDEVTIPESVLRRSYAFERLGTQAAVLDATGTIVDTNEAWRLFASLNEAIPGTTGPGVNYLEVCDRAYPIRSGDCQAAVAAGAPRHPRGRARLVRIRGLRARLLARTVGSCCHPTLSRSRFTTARASCWSTSTSPPASCSNRVSP